MFVNTKKVSYFLLSTVLILLLYTWFYKLPDNYQSQVVEYNDKIILDLKDVLSYLNQKPSIDPKFKQIKKQLLSAINYLERKQNVSSTKFDQVHNQDNLPYVCPEIFLNASIGKPQFIDGSWIRVKCSVQLPFAKLLSILLISPSKNYCLIKLPKILENIQKLYPDINFHVASTKKDYCSINQSVKFLSYVKSSTPGVIWNKLIEKVTTPFVLISRNLDDFNWFTRLERQVSVFNIDPRIKIVGGSIRNESGHWQVGCYQTRLLNYVLEYKDGYYSSKNECMFCDHLLGSFVARTDFLKKIKFNEDISENIVFEEFFLRIKNNSNLVMNCPDAMYMSTDPGIIERTSKRLSWIWLVQKEKLNRVELPDKIIHKYSCQEVGVTCSKLYKTSHSFMMPICCMDAVAHALEKFHEYCVKNDIIYQLKAGSVLGAVKFRDVIGWDTDGDGGYYEKNWDFFRRKLNLSDSEGEVLIKNQNEKKKGYFKILTLGFSIEMWPTKKLSCNHSAVPEVFRKIPTLMRIRGIWVYGPPSPGLHARNEYGREMLRHVNSWYSMKMKLGVDSYPVVDEFLPCRRPNHHTCINQHEVDGSVQFQFLGH